MEPSLTPITEHPIPKTLSDDYNNKSDGYNNKSDGYNNNLFFTTMAKMNIGSAIKSSIFNSSVGLEETKYPPVGMGSGLTNVGVISSSVNLDSTTLGTGVCVPAQYKQTTYQKVPIIDLSPYTIQSMTTDKVYQTSGEGPHAFYGPPTACGGTVEKPNAPTINDIIFAFIVDGALDWDKIDSINKEWKGTDDQILLCEALTLARMDGFKESARR